MLSQNIFYIPTFSSEAGSCLTTLNWQNIGVTRASFSLASLLLKPGMATLLQLTDLKSYLNWPGTLVLNAYDLEINRQGNITLISPFNGSRLQYSAAEICHLMRHLKPNMLILPKNLLSMQIWDVLDETIQIFIPIEEIDLASSKQMGLYWNIDKKKDQALVSQQLAAYSSAPRYLLGSNALEYYRLGLGPTSLSQTSLYLETDTPAQDALEGRTYNGEEIINLRDPKQGSSFDLLDSNCTCPTCKQAFTRAYLHHLYAHTPLLCHRYLIQHNVFSIYFDLGENSISSHN